MIGAASLGVGVLGIGLTVVFYVNSNAHRDLVYLVNSARTVVLRAGQTSRLDIRMGGLPVTSDVSAAQVAIWNDGKESIRPANMLRPLIIHLQGSHPVVEARIRKVGRDVAGISLDSSGYAKGEVAVNWDILEHNDGAVVQVLYLGSTDIPITATGVVEGQSSVRLFDKELATDIHGLPVWRFKAVVTNMLFGMMGMFAILYGVLMFSRLRRKAGADVFGWPPGRGIFARTIRALLLPLFLTVLFAALYAMLQSLGDRQPSPPFGF